MDKHYVIFIKRGSGSWPFTEVHNKIPMNIAGKSRWMQYCLWIGRATTIGPQADGQWIEMFNY